jgi:hypothetical protein
MADLGSWLRRVMVVIRAIQLVCGTGAARWRAGCSGPRRYLLAGVTMAADSAFM